MLATPGLSFLVVLAREAGIGAIFRWVARSRLRVLLLINKLAEQGGAERFTLGLAANLPRSRIEPWICVTRGASDYALQTLRAAEVPCVNIGRRGRWDSYRLALLLRLLRQRRFDVLHAHMFGSNVWGTLIGRFASVPVVLAHEHTWSYSGHPVRAWVDGRVIGRLSSRFIAVSRSDARRMVEYEHVPADRVLVMPTAYVPRKGANGNIRAELGLRSADPLVATAAVLRPQKAIDVLLDAFTLLRREVPNVHLVIAGDGPMRQELEHHMRTARNQEHVHFLGLRGDVESILWQADVAALASDYEGMPLFAFECMANRTPLVASSVGGLPELIEDGVSGVLVPPRNPKALAGALSGLLADSGRRERISAAASELLSSFTIDRVAAQYAELYERLVSEATR
jgi:glycosyltransferase involved in cell wall biosynthesis